jgi:GGDEF domain-containing protein
MGPVLTPEEFAASWIADVRKYEEGTPAREDLEATLRRQIVSVYGLKSGEGELPERDLRKLSHRLQLLGQLVVVDPDPVDLERAKEVAYDFTHLVWKDAYGENEVIDAQRRSNTLATHDALTGLLNRRGMSERLDDMIVRARANEYEGLALLYLDLDEFKGVNDALGHQRGDELLTGVSRLIVNNTRKPMSGRPADVIARDEFEGEAATNGPTEEERPEAESVRMGGDEFLLLIPYPHHPHQVGRAHPSRGVQEVPDVRERTVNIAGRLTHAITDYLVRQTEGRVPGLGVSIGYVLWEPDMSGIDLIASGDMHMYQIKRERKGLE